MQNHYKTLGVHKASTDEDIRFAYGRLALMNHPDLHDNNVEKASKMADLNVAYNVLKDVKKRKEYDKELLMLSTPCSVCKGRGAVMKQKGFAKKVAVACTVCGGFGTTEAV